MMVPEPLEQMWVDDDAGPVVRHYAMTSGRTRPTRGEFDLITLIMAARAATASNAGLQPEHAAIVRLCQNPMSVAELATQPPLNLWKHCDEGFLPSRLANTGFCNHGTTS